MHLSIKKVLILGGALLAVFVFYYLLFDKNIDSVVEGRIYRSARLTEKPLQKIIKQKGIRTIINLIGSQEDAEWYIRESAIARANGIRLFDLRLIPDELPTYYKLASVLDILSKSERPVLIHCLKGSDRTGMVSALALALEKDPPFPDIKKQFSWRYGVLPFSGSIGPKLFSRYEDWLNRTGKAHSKNTLIHWIRNEYLDNRANLEFYIDVVNGVPARDAPSLTGDPKKVVLEGWAFDARTKSPAEGLSIIIDNRISARAGFRNNRPDVAKFFGLGAEYDKSFLAGWQAEFQTVSIGKGCHKISVRVAGQGSEMFEVPTDYRFCL